MAAMSLLSAVDRDTVGAEVSLRVIGSREGPSNMVIQLEITGSANVQLEGRIARQAPWQALGPAHHASALVHIKAVQFLRVVASEVAAGSSVSVWADWSW